MKAKGKFFIFLACLIFVFLIWLKVIDYKWGEKKRNVLYLRDIHKYAHAGDIIFFSTIHMDGRIRKVMTSCEFTHCGILAFHPETGAPLLFHSTKNDNIMDHVTNRKKVCGVQIVDLTKRITDFPGYAAIRRFAPKSCAETLRISEKEFNQRLYDLAKEMSGTPWTYNIAENFVYAYLVMRSRSDYIENKFKDTWDLDITKGVNCTSMIVYVFERLNLWSKEKSVRGAFQHFPHHFDQFHADSFGKLDFDPEVYKLAF